MQILGSKKPLLLWGAERPFQLQLLAALGRLGMDVFALTEGIEGKKLIDQIHPKNSDKLEIPDTFDGHVIWAPSIELFSNSKLSELSNKDLSAFLKATEENPKIEKCFLLLPQNSYSELSRLQNLSQKNHALFFPTLLSFGDKNVLDGLFNQLLDSGLREATLEGNFLSIFDAVSMSLALIQRQDSPAKLWAKGQSIPQESLLEGFAEVPKAGLLGSIQNFIQKIAGHKNQFDFENTTRPAEIAEALDVFPTVLTPWERFFRDSYRIYQQTEDSGLLLHFRPTKSP